MPPNLTEAADNRTILFISSDPIYKDSLIGRDKICGKYYKTLTVYSEYATFHAQRLKDSDIFRP